MALPTVKTDVTADINAAYWLIYGPPGIGKSSLVSQFPDPLFLTTEQAHRHLKILNQPVKDWLHFKQIIAELGTAAGKAYRSIAIDIIDNLYKLCLEQVCKEHDMEHPSDEAYGKGFDLVNTAFQREIVKLTLLGKGIFFISHQKQMEVTSRNMKYSKLVPSLSGGGHKIILPIVDFEMYFGFSSNDVNKRAGFFEPKESLEAKDRFGRMPKEVLLPKDGMYAALKAAWDGKAQALPAPAAPVAPAGPRRVSKL